jgi:metal-responsive CopG/Arc/MetJ family transcriptional regulator
MASALTRIGVSMHRKDYDTLAFSFGESRFVTRSEFIREAIKHYIADSECQSPKGTEQAGTVIIVFDRSQPGAVVRLNRIQQQYLNIVRSCLELPLEGGYYIRLVVLTGEASAIVEFADKSMGGKGIKKVLRSMASIDSKGKEDTSRRVLDV